MMSPEEVLAVTMAPSLRAVDNYGRNTLELAQAQFRDANIEQLQSNREKAALALQANAQTAIAARQSASDVAMAQRQRENDAAQLERQKIGDAAAMERTKEQVVGYIKRAKEASQAHQVEKLMSEGHIPKEGEEFGSFLARATKEKAEKEEKLGRQAASVLDGFEDQMGQMQAKIDEEQTKYDQEVAKVAGERAFRSFTGVGGPLTPDDRKELKKFGPIPMEAAINLYAATGNPRGVELQQLFTDHRNDGTVYAHQVVKQPNIKKWEDQKNSVGIKMNQFYMTPSGQRGHGYRLMNPKTKSEEGDGDGGSRENPLSVLQNEVAGEDNFDTSGFFEMGMPQEGGQSGAAVPSSLLPPSPAVPDALAPAVTGARQPAALGNGPLEQYLNGISMVLNGVAQPVQAAGNAGGAALSGVIDRSIYPIKSALQSAGSSAGDWLSQQVFDPMRSALTPASAAPAYIPRPGEELRAPIPVSGPMPGLRYTPPPALTAPIPFQGPSPVLRQRPYLGPVMQSR